MEKKKRIRKFLEQANRGLLLGVIITLLVAAYLLFDYISFYSEREQILEVAQGFLSDMNALNTEENVFDDESFDETLGKISRILDTYFCDRSDPEGDYAKTKSRLLSGWEACEGSLTALAEGSKVTDADVEFSELTVTKSSPGSAVVTVEVTYRYVMEIPSESFICYQDDESESYALTAVYGADSYSYCYPQVSTADLKLGSTVVWNETRSGSCSMELYRVDGEWRISGLYDGGFVAWW
ncbi:MAG: hypothetical protein LUE29_00790 [Lachnospiraceae bacterium]|nr:hypothetical protein [Lachnospiraceae bacterium]